MRKLRVRVKPLKCVPHSLQRSRCIEHGADQCTHIKTVASRGSSRGEHLLFTSKVILLSCCYSFMSCETKSS